MNLNSSWKCRAFLLGHTKIASTSNQIKYNNGNSKTLIAYKSFKNQ